MAPNPERGEQRNDVPTFAGNTPEQFLRALGYCGDIRDTSALNRFRRLYVARFHPDKGGNPQTMTALNVAVENAIGPKSGYIFDSSGNLVQGHPSISSVKNREPSNDREILKYFITYINLDLPDYAYNMLYEVVEGRLQNVMNLIDNSNNMRSAIITNIYKKNKFWQNIIELIASNKDNFPNLSKLIVELRTQSSSEIALNAILAAFDANIPEAALQWFEIVFEFSPEQLQNFDQEMNRKIMTLINWVYNRDSEIKKLGLKIVAILAKCEKLLPISHKRIMSHVEYRLTVHIITNGSGILEQIF